MNQKMRQTAPRFLDAPDVARAWNAVRDLSSEFVKWEQWSSQPLAISGWWGGAILHLAYHQRIERSDAREKAVSDLLDVALAGAGRFRYANFYGGLSGLGWGMEHVSTMMGDEVELDDLDDWLCSVVDQGAVRDHELIGGLVGIGYYGLERVHHEKARQLVSSIVLMLERQARLQIDGLAWYKHAEFLSEWQREKLPNGCWNLGLSHGIPGVIGFLSYAARAGVCADVATHLLEQSVPWLIRQYFRIGERWHVSSTVEGPRPEHSRLAWCYNELGTTMPILIAADALGRDEWRAFAVDVLHSLESIEIEQSGVYNTGEVRDPAVCHGIAGIAHLFAHSARALDDASLADTARRWMKLLLDARSDRYGVCGFPRFGAPDKVTNARPVESDPGFLEGASGVGLVLLSALADEEPGWNRILGM